MVEAKLVRWVLLAFWGACAIVLVVGAMASLRTEDEHWIERCGKVVVAMALILTYLQFRYEVEHASAERVAVDTAAAAIRRKQVVAPQQQARLLRRVATLTRSRLEADRGTILLNALMAAALGELVSAFGGLAVRFVM